MTETIVPLARLRDVLASARSLTEASKLLGVSCNRLGAYYRATTDDGVRALYRACVQRGKSKSAVPLWRVLWHDPMTPGKPVCIWTIHTETRERALEQAVNATGREPKTLTVEEVKR